MFYRGFLQSWDQTLTKQDHIDNITWNGEDNLLILWQLPLQISYENMTISDILEDSSTMKAN